MDQREKVVPMMAIYGADRLRSVIKGKTFLPSFSDTAQRLNLTTWKGVKSFQRDTFELPRRIWV